MVTSYEADVLHLLVWIVGVLSTALIAVSLWVARKVIADLANLKDLMIKDLQGIRELFHGIDKRVIRLETLAMKMPTPLINHDQD